MIVQYKVEDTMHFLITGHNGFKGAWLSLLLAQRGHSVSGISLEPLSNSLFKNAKIEKFLTNNFYCDIRDADAIKEKFSQVNPDVVIHLAAQSLVRQSYLEPMETFETNALGTLNVLKATQELTQVSAQLIITTDKVYRNQGKSTGYSELDPLGGNDPYSASKAMADLAAQSWISSYSNPPTSIARAGNVIGGGDISLDRLIPDLVESFSNGLVPKLRAPDSIRPWQHVLDCLNGYLTLIEVMTQDKKEGIWNFGPDENQIRTVGDVASLGSRIWGLNPYWDLDKGQHPHEESILTLNSSKAFSELGWGNKLKFEESVFWTFEWYKNVRDGSDPLKETMNQIKKFESI
jgi:CDP-glucose 4,6-dehydratase